MRTEEEWGSNVGVPNGPVAESPLSLVLLWQTKRCHLSFVLPYFRVYFCKKKKSFQGNWSPVIEQSLLWKVDPTTRRRVRVNKCGSIKKEMCLFSTCSPQSSSCLEEWLCRQLTSSSLLPHCIAHSRSSPVTNRMAYPNVFLWQICERRK